ncbi:MAG: DMT family transporter [Rhodobacteraceae bacterium]|nr:DMT family transporter [Paracoccaceae bacterium]
MLRAALLMIVAMSLIPLGDAAGKLLVAGHGASPLFVAWSRFALGAALLLPFLGRRHLDARALVDPRTVLRGLLIVGGIVSILTALRTEPLGNVFGAFFVGPILSFALSAALLGERVRAVQAGLLGLGFAGVLLVVKPGFGMTPGLGFAVLAGCFYGCFLVASKWLSDAYPPRTLLLSQLVTGAVVLAPFGIPRMPEVDGTVAFLVLVSAAGSMAGNLLLILAYKVAPATRMAPFVYFQLVAATALGFAVFGDAPDALTWAGLGLLVLSGFASLGLRAAGATEGRLPARGGSR